MADVYESYGRSSESDRIPNYMAPALIALLCCWPLAILALISATRVNKRIEAGDLAGARRASQSARGWSLTAIGLGVMAFFVFAIAGIFLLSQVLQYSAS